MAPARLIGAGRNWLGATALILGAITLPALARGQDTTGSTIPSDGPHGFLFKQPSLSLGIRGLFDLRRAQSGVFTYVTDALTLSKSDFDAFGAAFDLGVRVANPVDLVLGAGYTRTSKQSEFRDYVDQNNLPITQTTTLTTTPLTLAARWYPTARGRQIGRFVWIPARVVPYVGVGGGAIYYSLTQAGSFVDTRDLSVFDATLSSDGWAPVGLVMAGLDYSLGTRVFVNADARYIVANGALHQDFVQFTDGIDLSTAQFSLGLHVRL